MTYGIKLIRFQDRDCYILLQNENGPCPLLAASNGLILQGIISLPISSISNNFATLDDVTNILADHAVQKHLSLSTSSLTKPTIKASELDSIETNTCTDPKSTTVTSNSIESSTDFGTIQYESDTTYNDVTSQHHQKTQQQQQQQQKQNLETNELSKNPNSNENDNSNINFENDNDKDASNTAMFYINELMTYIPKFQYGMDFNPKFIDGIYGYEYTAEMTAFDMLHCKIVHGWLINPFIEEELYTIIGRKSYNELVDILISYNDNRTTIENNLISLLSKIDTLQQQQQQQQDMQQQQLDPQEQLSPHKEDDSDNIEQQIQSLQKEYDAISTKLKEITIMENFLQVTSHQLTSYGLETLQQEIGCNDICVFFRNNHYSTIYKNPSTQLLYLLVSDMGYADSPHIIWEKLDVINGDTEYCNDQFVPNKQNTHSITNANTSNTATSSIGLIEDDYQLAVRLSMEDQAQYNQHNPSRNNLYQQQQQQSWLSKIPTTTNNAVGTPTFSSIATGVTNVINDLATKIGATSTTASSGSVAAVVAAKALPTTGSTGTPRTNSTDNPTIHTSSVPLQQQQQQATIVTIPHSKLPAVKTAVAVQEQQQQLQSQQSATNAIDAESVAIGLNTPKQDTFPTTTTTNPSPTIPIYSTSNSATEAADRMLALQLQEHDDHHPRQQHNSSSDIDSRDMYEQESLRLALQLQEEDRMRELHYQQQQQLQQQRLQATHIPNQQSTPTRNSNRTAAMTPAVASQQQQQAVLQTPPQEQQQQQQQQQQQTPRRRLLTTFQQQQNRVGSSGGGINTPTNTNSVTTPSTTPMNSTATAAGNAKDANCVMM